MTFGVGQSPREVQASNVTGVQIGAPPQAPARTQTTSWIGRLMSRIFGSKRQAAAAETTQAVSTGPLGRAQSAPSGSFFGKKEMPSRQESMPQMRSRRNGEGVEVNVEIKTSSTGKSASAPKPGLKSVDTAEGLIEKLRNEKETLAELKTWGQESHRTDNSEFLLKVLNSIKLEQKKDATGDVRAEVAEKLKQLNMSQLKYIYVDHIRKTESARPGFDFSGSAEINISNEMYEAIKAGYDHSSIDELSKGIADAFYEIAKVTAGNMQVDRATIGPRAS